MEWPAEKYGHIREIEDERILGSPGKQVNWPVVMLHIA